MNIRVFSCPIVATLLTAGRVFERDWQTRFETKGKITQAEVPMIARTLAPDGAVEESEL